MARNNYLVSFTIRNPGADKRRRRLVNAIAALDSSSFKIDRSAWFVTYGKGYTVLASNLASFLKPTDSLLVCSLGQRVALWGNNLQLSTLLKYKFNSNNVTTVKPSPPGQHGK
jgi:hypothetical protein